MSKTLSKDSGMKIDYQFFRDTGQDPGLSWQTRTSGGPNHRAGGRKWGTVAILPFLFHTVSPSKLGCVLILTGEKKRRKKKLIPTWSKVLGFFLPSSSSWRFIKYWYWMLIIFFPKGVIKIELLFRTLPLIQNTYLKIGTVCKYWSNPKLILLLFKLIPLSSEGTSSVKIIALSLLLMGIFRALEITWTGWKFFSKS